ncbi:MAG: SEL1-like repeat protein [Alphaproteobacteria bacterium]|nr:SEL1-like repeat protein [Alphaproteobacteria bacterium]
MGFKRTAEGRVFFQGKNVTANDHTAQSGTSRTDNRDSVVTGPISQAQQGGQSQQTQVQIVALLKTLNERLKITQAERTKMRKELDAYRDMIEELEQKAAYSEQAYRELESRVARKLETSQNKLLTEETIKELEETRKLLLDVESKAERADQGFAALKGEVSQTRKISDQVLKKQTELETEQKQQGQKLVGSALHYTELTKRVREAEERQENLSGRVGEAETQQARLIRKIDKAVEDRARFMRKIERIEETVLQTRDSLNAKAMVLLTDQALATQAGIEGEMFFPDDNAQERPQEALQGLLPAEDGAPERPATRKIWKNILWGTGIAALGTALIAGGWFASQVDLQDMRSWFTPAQHENFDFTEPSTMPPEAALEAPQPEDMHPPSPLNRMNWQVEDDTSAAEIAPSPAETDAAVIASTQQAQNAARTLDDIGTLDLNDQAQIAAILEGGNIDRVAPQMNEIEPGTISKETAKAIELARLNADAEKVKSDTQNAKAPVQAVPPAEEVKNIEIRLPALEFKPIPAGNPHDVIKQDAALQGVVKDIETQAFNGVPEAQHDLAAIYTAGHSNVKQNYERAAAWFRQAAAQGVANANYNLGVLYHQGLGVKQNMDEAIKWYQNAAALGHPEAQYNLGIAYIEGIGVPYDPGAAAAFFQSAAEGGITEAAYNLGLIYENGLLGEAKPDLAIMWYKTAADNGSPEAQQALEQLAKTLGIKLEDVNTLADKVRAEQNAGAAPKTLKQPPLQQQQQNTSAVEPQKSGLLETSSTLTQGDLLQDDIHESASTNSTPHGDSQLLTAQVQELLMQAGLYPGPADGVSGPVTEDAIRTYQSRHGLKSDGKASKALLSHMMANALENGGQNTGAYINK